MIPRTFIDDLINRTDIVEVIQTRVPLKKGGRDYSARCPFHDEKSPSFTVSQPKQFYYCFGCGAHGNVLQFVMDYDRLDFVDAVEYLANLQGVDVPQDDQQKSQRQSYKELYPILQEVTEIYQAALKSSDVAINYLKGRGLTGQIAKTFAIGFAPDEWHLLEKEFTKAEQRTQLKTHGLLLTQKNGELYDRFRNRVMFPIRDVRGRVIAFGGRTLGDDPAKYMNSPETPIFHKGEELYGLYEARQANRALESIVVVEGYMDVVALAQAGVTNAVATLGTATSTKHVQKLLRYTPQIVFSFDGDKAGRAAAWKALATTLPLMNDGVQCKFLFLPEGHDPDSFVLEFGQQGWQQSMEQAVAITDFFFQELERRIPLESLDAKARFAKEAQSYLDTIPGGIFNELMHAQLSQLVGVQMEGHAATPPTQAAPSASTAQVPTELSAPMKLILSLLLQHPKLASQIDIPEFKHVTPLGGKLLIKLQQRLSQDPNLSIGGLLQECEHPAEQHCIAEMSAWQHNIAEEEQLPELQNALKRLLEIERKTLRERLIQKSRQTPLSDSEKQQLQELLG